MSRPSIKCDGDCFHCPLPDCCCDTFPPYRATPFEREQSEIRREKARRARQEDRHRKQVEQAFREWKKRNGIGKGGDIFGD